MQAFLTESAASLAHVLFRVWVDVGCGRKAKWEEVNNNDKKKNNNNNGDCARFSLYLVSCHPPTPVLCRCCCHHHLHLTGEQTHARWAWSLPSKLPSCTSHTSNPNPGVSASSQVPFVSLPVALSSVQGRWKSWRPCGSRASATMRRTK